jgi:hypothetical protein
MMNSSQPKLTLDFPATYQIRIPGVPKKGCIDWDGVIDVEVQGGRKSSPSTSLTFIGDQAALQGFLRRLYSLGLPLISVNLLPPVSE